MNRILVDGAIEKMYPDIADMEVDDGILKEVGIPTDVLRFVKRGAEMAGISEDEFVLNAIEFQALAEHTGLYQAIMEAIHGELVRGKHEEEMKNPEDK